MLNPLRLERMRSTQETAMIDGCRHIPYTPSRLSGGYGDTIDTGEPAADVVPCRLSHATGGSSPTIKTGEGAPGEQVVKTEWNLRLPASMAGLAQPFDSYDYVIRAGVALETAIRFEQLGDAIIGPSAVLVKVKRVTL